MKKLSLALALLLALTAFASCADGGDTSTTTVADYGGSPAATGTTPSLTLPPIDPGNDTTPGEDEPLYEIEAFPNATAGDVALEGYEVWGYWNEGMSEDALSFFAFTNDTMKSGKLTATFTAIEGAQSDNGIVFGMEDDVNEQIWYWEDGPSYYMLFVADAGTLYLAKVIGSNPPETRWNICQVTAEPIPGYVHGNEITITAEFDGAGNIKGYADGVELINYTDPSPLNGSRYGVRAEVSGVTFSEIVAEHG